MSTEMAELLKSARRRLRYTQLEMANIAGVKRTTYANYELGVANPPEEVLNKLQPILNSQSASDQGADYKVGGKGHKRLASDSGFIPIYRSISAGQGDFDTSESSDDDLLAVPNRFVRPDYSGVVAEGDSMMPLIQPGDVLIFKNQRHPRLNKIISVRSLSGGPAMVKKLITIDNVMALASLNSRYDPMPFENYEVLGVLVGIHSTDGELTFGPIENGLDETTCKTSLSPGSNEIILTFFAYTP
jgi:transcriptional regulator with XRE-family HTH domain